MNHLDLSNNHLHSYPSNLQFPNLQSLILSNCSLGGNLAHFFSLIKFYLSLDSLDISLNSFTGTLPVYETMAVSRLMISGNRISGTLPSDMHAVYSNLVTLDVSRNLLTGTLPDFNHTYNIQELYVLMIFWLCFDDILVIL